MLKLHNLAAIALSAMLFITGCAGSNGISHEVNESEAPDKSRSVVVGFCQVGSESDWRIENTASFKRVFTEENGYYLIFKDAQQKQENQLKAIRQFILQEVDYIVLAPIVETGWDEVLLEAKDAGIPVILEDRRIDVEDDSLYTCWVGSDFFKEGQTAAEWLAEYLEGEDNADKNAGKQDGKDSTDKSTSQQADKNSADKENSSQENGKEKIGKNASINIVTLQGTLDSSAQIGRTEGFASVLKEHPDWNMLDRRSGDFTQAKGREVMEQLLADYDDIDVVVCENDNMAFGAIEAITDAGKTCGPEGDIILLSFDAASKSAFNALIERKMNADFVCEADTAPAVHEVIQKLIADEQVDKIQYVEEGYYDTSMNLVETMERLGY